MNLEIDKRIIPVHARVAVAGGIRSRCSMCWRTLSYSTFLLLGFLVLTGPCRAQDPNYVFEKPTKRLALVVANADYEGESKLPGTVDDAKTVSEILSAAGFDVIDARNVSRSEFLTLHLIPFLGKIEQDDFVVFYFSGHGFSYGGENYLAPLQFPKTVTANEVFNKFISVSAVQDLISEKSPGFLLILLDACRNIAEFITPSAPTPNRIEKGLAFMRSPPGNIEIGFSSDLGKPSIGSSVAGQLSTYTKSLSRFLPKEDTDFDKVKKDVHFDVLFTTEDQQKPWFSEGSSAEVYFRPSATLLGQERDAWLAALAAKDRYQITRFLKRYNVGRFAKAARKWLDDNQDRPRTAFTRISPLGPELAWANAQDAAGESIKLRRIEGPLAFSRVARAPSETASAILISDVAAAPRTPTPADPAHPAALPTRPAGVFAKHGEAVVTGPIAARERPDERAKIIAPLASNTKLAVEGFEVDARNQTWAQVRAPGVDQALYVAVSPTTVTRSTDIGKPLLEIKVGDVPGGLKTLADAKTAVEALKKLREGGRSVAWVSIATPVAAQETARDLFSARAAHLTYVFDREGVSRQRISVVEQAADLQGEELRVRFFGN